MTSPQWAKENCVSVKSAYSLNRLFDIFGGLLIGYLFKDKIESASNLLPNGTQLLGILWIGIFTTLATALYGRLINELSHATVQPIQSLRPLFGFFFLLLSAHTLSTQELNQRLLAVLLVIMGASIAFWLGKPFKQQFQ